MFVTRGGSRIGEPAGILGQRRSTQLHIARGREDEVRLVAEITELAFRHGRYGYRWISALSRQGGCEVNDKRVERLWRRLS